jgi:hypothetical protein
MSAAGCDARKDLVRSYGDGEVLFERLFELPPPLALDYGLFRGVESAGAPKGRAFAIIGRRRTVPFERVERPRPTTGSTKGLEHVIARQLPSLPQLFTVTKKAAVMARTKPKLHHLARIDRSVRTRIVTAVSH